jgi:hypothetical protein
MRCPHPLQSLPYDLQIFSTTLHLNDSTCKTIAHFFEPPKLQPQTMKVNDALVKQN